jgi:hypothetical protein
LKQSAKGAEYESRGQVPGKAFERPKYHGYYALSAPDQIVFSHQGRRAPFRFALAPGFHIPQLWRSVSTFCAKPIRGFFLPQSRRSRKDYAETISH